MKGHARRQNAGRGCFAELCDVKWHNVYVGLLELSTYIANLLRAAYTIAQHGTIFGHFLLDTFLPGTKVPCV